MFKRINFFLLFPLIILIYFLTLGIDLPYVGPNATNFNTYSLIAKNYNNFGFINTKFAPIVSVSKNLPLEPEYYLHHPQLLSIFESFLFKIFGGNFWVGRLTVIIFAFLSWFLIYKIAEILKGKKFSLIIALTSSFIPAFSVFGRMIGQEALVLFFGLLFLFSTLNYLKSKDLKYLLLMFLSIVLGIFSDWPMFYFVFSFVPLFILKKKTKLLLFVISGVILTLASFVLYVFILKGGLSELTSAFLNRSLGSLVGQQYWPIKWFLTILLRLFIYFNPFFVLFSFLYFYKVILEFKKRIFSEENLIILGLFLFPFFHVLLYPEGSFGHPYWTYYFVPFVSLSASFFLLEMLKKKQFIFLFLISIGSLIFLFKIEDWKIKEIESNIWRYELAKNVNKYLQPYETILVNDNSLIDPDILKYSFNHPTKVIDTKNNFDKFSNKYFLYSPLGEDNYSKQLKDDYESVQISSNQGNVGIFFLNMSVREKKRQEMSKKNEVKTTIYPYNENFFKKVYIFIKEFLNVPQI